MPASRTTKIGGIECRVTLTRPFFSWQAQGAVAGKNVVVSGFNTDSEAYEAWKVAAKNLVAEAITVSPLVKPSPSEPVSK